MELGFAGGHSRDTWLTLPLKTCTGPPTPCQQLCMRGVRNMHGTCKHEPCADYGPIKQLQREFTYVIDKS